MLQNCSAWARLARAIEGMRSGRFKKLSMAVAIARDGHGKLLEAAGSHPLDRAREPRPGRAVLQHRYRQPVAADCPRARLSRSHISFWDRACSSAWVAGRTTPDRRACC